MALPVIYVAGALAYEFNREHFPRLDLPAFDHAKAKALKPEKRAAYEQELFSELQQWNRGSRKYPTLEDIERREQRWQQMADDGFELAHITLSVLTSGPKTKDVTVQVAQPCRPYSYKGGAAHETNRVSRKDQEWRSQWRSFTAYSLRLNIASICDSDSIAANENSWRKTA